MATTEKYNYPCFLPGAFLQRSVLKGNSRSVQIYKCQNGSCAKFTEVESKLKKNVLMIEQNESKMSGSWSFSGIYCHNLGFLAFQKS